MSEADLAPSRLAARERASAFRESERQNLALMEACTLPQLRDKYRTAAERYAVLAEADERLAAAPTRAPYS